MANDATEVVVGADGHVYVGPTATTAPTLATDTLDADFVDLGYVSEDGATISDSKDVSSIGAWQSFYAIRKVVTGREFTVSFALRQWNKDTVEFALGGTVSANSTQWKLVPPTATDTGEVSFILEWEDGSRHYRLYIPSAMVVEAVETNIVRTDAADLPITISAQSNGTDDVYTLFTDDDNFTVV